MNSLERTDYSFRSGEFYEDEIIFVGNYLPRKCGIATFTTDLREAVYQHYRGSVFLPVIAMNDQEEGYDYPSEVEWTIAQSSRQDYERAVEFVNRSHSKLLCLQHEYGIFGGKEGVYILDFLSQVKLPIVVTLHTVLDKPNEGQRDVITRLAPMVSKFVVMTPTASRFLERSYHISKEKIALIPHGIPELLPGNSDYFKSVLNLSGRTIFLTFGLLSKNKGIETVLEALPKVVKRFKKVAFVILGVTHPVVKRNEGESYRIMLRRMVRELGLERHVFFHDQFVSLEQLTEYLQATDIYITPYLSKTQIVSGTLAYASGSGIPVLSTPYWYAEDLLAEGKGILFPFKNSKKLETLLLNLLAEPQKLEVIRRKAFKQGRKMIWPAVGRQYADLFHEVISEYRRKKSVAKPVLVSTELPEISLRHVRRLTDKTGILQHAYGIVPNRKEGYCLDDNARALLMAAQHFKQTKSEESFELATIYLSYIQYSQKEDGRFYNFMNYQLQFFDETSSEDSHGRTLWALGVAIQVFSEQSLGIAAQQVFHQSKYLALQMGLHGTALAILGLSEYLEAHPEDKETRLLLAQASDRLMEFYKRGAAGSWQWFDEKMTYDNGLLPLALLKAYRHTQNKKYLTVANKTQAFLEKVYFQKGYLQLIGNQKWLSASEKGALYDEQPIDAMASVLLFRELYLVLKEKKYLELMRRSFDWFLGKNRLGKSLYDFESAGCRDGLMKKEVNLNQGAESTLSYMISVLAMTEVSYINTTKSKEELVETKV